MYVCVQNEESFTSVINLLVINFFSSLDAHGVVFKNKTRVFGGWLCKFMCLCAWCAAVCTRV